MTDRDLQRKTVGRVVAGQQSFLGEPETVAPAEDSFKRATVAGQDAGRRNAEVQVWFDGDGI